ncbi:MAG TPA: high-potential iron-sulfur protein [Steroidobacteraceae bacterium]
MILRAVQLVSAIAVLPAVAARAAAAESCVDPSSEALRESLNYKAHTPDAAQPCHGCGFFTADKASCGNCTIMSGPVDADGHCDSWSAKS